MKTTITIECETLGELTSHLYNIIKGIKKVAIKKGLDPSDEFSETVRLSDSNCYGDHDVEIEPEFPEVKIPDNGPQS